MALGKSKLMTLYRALSKIEMNALKKLLLSPYFNRREDVVKLFNYFYKCRFSIKIRPNKEDAYTFVYPQQPYKDNKFRSLLNILLELSEEYLCQKELSSNSFNKKILACSAYRKINHDKLFTSELAATRKYLKESTYRDSSYYEDVYRLQLEEYTFTTRTKRIEELNLQQTSDSLDIYYLALKLKQSCLLLSHQTVYRKEYDQGLLPLLLEKASEPKYLQIPAIAIYLYAFHALTEKEDIYFNLLKELLIKNGDLFPVEEISNLYFLAINICIKKLNLGKNRYAREAFELYKISLEKEYLIQSKAFNHFTYKNIFNAGILAGEFEWTENFLKEYKPFLEVKIREETYSLNLAQLEFSREHYSLVLRLLHKSEYKDLLMSLTAKTIELKTYFEMDEMDLLEAHIEAMEKFIRRKTMMGYHKEIYIETIRLVKKMLRVNPFDKKEKRDLIEEIQATKAIAEKRWLLKSVGNL